MRHCLEFILQNGDGVDDLASLHAQGAPQPVGQIVAGEQPLVINAPIPIKLGAGHELPLARLSQHGDRNPSPLGRFAQQDQRHCLILDGELGIDKTSSRRFRDFQALALSLSRLRLPTRKLPFTLLDLREPATQHRQR
jgi:hypothetical protein